VCLTGAARGAGWIITGAPAPGASFFPDMLMRKPLTPGKAPAMAGVARRLYFDGVAVAEIVRRTGLKRASVYYWADREVAPDGSVTLRPAARRRADLVEAAAAAPDAPERIAPAAEPPPPGKPARGRLLIRLWRAAERQLDEIEARLAHAAAPPAEGETQPPRAAADSEKDARALAVLARTLRELSALEAEARKSWHDSRKGKAEDDAVRDLDTFRRELARRLDRLREGGDGAEPAG